MGPIQRLLVRLPNWLGDALMARPALHALRAAWPDAEVRAVGPAALLELLAGDRVFDSARAWPRDPGERMGLLAETLDWGPETALVLPPSFSSAWFAWRTGAGARVGFAHEARAPLLTRAVRRPARGDLHLSREYLMLAAELGAAPVEPGALAVPPGMAGQAEGLLARLGIASAPFSILGPGALYGPAKRWRPERFATLGRSLAERGHVVLVCGAASERDTCLEVARAVGAGTHALAGETTLPVQAALCARAALVVCNDSGLGHLAAAVGAPTVVIFGSTSSSWTAPTGPRVRIVQRPPACSPCFARTCRVGYACLERVAAADVERAILEVAA